MKKLKLIGSGNKGERNFFILSKEESFFSLFPMFLFGCGFIEIGIYETYQENKPDINRLSNKIEHFQNIEYDIDVIYTVNRIILIVRTDVRNKNKLVKGIEKITTYLGFK